MNDYDLAELEAERLLSSLRGENLARIKRLCRVLRLACLVAAFEFLVIVVGAIFAL
jgi:hypothetical protein